MYYPYPHYSYFPTVGQRPLGRVTSGVSSFDRTKAGRFAEIQDAIKRGSYRPAVNALIQQFNVVPDPSLATLKSASGPRSYDVWYGIVEGVQPGLPFQMPGMPFQIIGTFTEAEPGSFEEVAFGLEAQSNERNHLGFSLRGAPQPLLIYPRPKAGVPVAP